MIMKNGDVITVTRPLMPPLEELLPYLEQIWKSGRITNEGFYHTKLEGAIRDYLEVPYVSLFTNGTLALMCALKALQIDSGEVITTPYSFVATSHALWMSGLNPVFVDIDPIDFNLDPDKIEQAVTQKTKAILPVHVYGTPCKIDRIQKIADKYGLRVIYDAAHAFAVGYRNQSLLAAGDLSVVSFNATKVYNTLEGGAIISYDKGMKDRIDKLRSFGFISETEVEFPGLNGKMDEIRSAYGLVGLKYVDQAIKLRQNISEYYREKLEKVKGLSFLPESPDVKPNYSYFPIIIDSTVYGMSRDELYVKMKEDHILCRRYFYPLISSFFPYNEIPSAKQTNLPVANRIANTVLCLPVYPDLSESELQRIINHIIPE